MFALAFFLQILLWYLHARCLGVIKLGVHCLGTVLCQALHYFLGNGPDLRTHDYGMEAASRSNIESQ